jgi:hypothetical protein
VTQRPRRRRNAMAVARVTTIIGSSPKGEVTVILED